MCFLEDKALTFKGNRAADQEASALIPVWEVILRLRFLSTCKASLSEALSAQQGSLPRASRAHGTCAAVGAHLFGPHMPISKKTLQDVPLHRFINLFKVYIHIPLYY